ncbi:MAG: glycosyltransferase [Verrucomicrobia bacterium]|nr:glycosyltransferase [Verrucomicrobiota bacterium]
MDGSVTGGGIKPNMRLGMVTGSLSRDAGGLFESVRALGKSVSNLGVDVSVYGLWDKNWRLDEEAWRPLQPKVFSYKGPRAIAWAPEMDVALEKAQADVLHLHGLWQYPSIATRRQWKSHQTPYVISPRGMLDPWALRNSRWKKWLAGQFFENAVLRDATCLHALCDSEADSMRAYGLTQRIEVIPNGVDLPELLTTEDTESTEGVKRLLFLGRIHPKKGLVNALRAWANIRNSPSAIRNSQEWQFVIAGWDQGGHEAELKALCVELGLRVFAGGPDGRKQFNHGVHGEHGGLVCSDRGPNLAGQVGAAFSNPSLSELVRDSEKTSPTRYASGPAEEALCADDMGLGRSAGGNQLADPKEFLEGQSQDVLQMDNQKRHAIRPANAPGASGTIFSSVPIRDIRGQNSNTLDSVDVVFYGPAFGEEKEALLRSADAFILPSLSEGLPMSVLEAWAYGLPVLMTAECNLPEGFSAGAAIPLPSFQDHFQFTGERIRAISTLLEMSDRERVQMGKLGRTLVEQKFTWPKVANQLHEIYHHILA